MLRTAIVLIASVAAQADIVEDAFNTKDIDSFGEPTIQGMTQVPAAGAILAEAPPKTKKKTTADSTSFYGGSIMTPALTPWSIRSGQRPAKIGYKVPNFGVDHDIKATQKHEKDTSKKLGAWNPKKDKDDKWIVPTENAFFRI